MNSKNNRLVQLNSDQQMLVGIQKHLSALSAFPVGSQTVGPPDVIKVYQDRIATAQAAQAAHAAVSAAVKANRDKRAQTAPFHSAFTRIVQGMFAQSPDVLADFGLKPLKTRPKSVATKAEALAKGQATRAARHTMGPKQKEDVKGDVTGVVITPVTASAPAITPPVTTAAPASPQAPAPASVTAPVAAPPTHAS